MVTDFDTWVEERGLKDCRWNEESIRVHLHAAIWSCNPSRSDLVTWHVSRCCHVACIKVHTSILPTDSS